jgi:hypothetical protein
MWLCVWLLFRLHGHWRAASFAASLTFILIHTTYILGLRKLFTPRTGARRWVISHFYKYVLSRFELASTDPRYCCPSRRISVTIVRPLGGLAAVSSVRWYDTPAVRMLLTGFPKGPGYLRALLATFARKLAYMRAAPADVPSYGLGAIKTSSSITSVSLEELFVNRPQLRG